MTTPGDYPTSLQLWLKADAITGLSDGAAVGSWADSSSSGNTATQSTAGSKPTYKTGILNGQPVVRFDGNDYLTSAAPSWATAQTVVAVVKSTSLAGVNTIRGGGSAIGGLQFRIEASPTSNLRFVKQAVADIGQGNVAVTANAWHVVTGTWNDAADAYSFTIDGAAAGSGTSTQVLAVSSTAIGANGQSLSEFFTGDMAELAAWDRVLTSTELNAVVAGLQSKWLPGPVLVSPPTAHATAAALAPLVMIPLLILAPTAHADAAALAPTVQVAGVQVSPPTAHATATGAVPDVALGSFQVSPPTAHATASGAGPAVTLSALQVSPPTATATATSTTPSVTVGALSVAAPTAHASAVGISPAVTVRTIPATWSVDLSQRTIAPFTSAVTSPTFVPPLQAAPPQIVERPILRESITVPDPNTLTPESVRTDPTTGQVVIRDDVYDAFPRTTSVVGVPHIFIDGRDVTYFRGVSTLVRSDDATEPFGDDTLVVEFPQIDSLDDHDATELAWLRPGAAVHHVMQRWDSSGPTGEITTLFHGFLVSDDTGNSEDAMQTVWTARGDGKAAAMAVWQPRVITTPVDLGVQLAKAMNSVTNRRYGKVAPVTTGIPTVQRGDSGTKVMAYAQRLLADATTESGDQYTVAKKRGTKNTLEIRRKRTGRVWIVTNGQRGIELNLSTDSTESRNVFYGRGQRSDGGVWMRKLYPAGTSAPSYPFTSPGSVMSIGTTDASTSTGDGVSLWQRRAKALGFHVTVDGVYNGADASVARQLQAQYGIQVDGVVGPQTWAETFDVGALSADPNGWVRLPLAWLPGAMQYRYRANGTIIGEDPAWDKTMVINSDDLELGTDLDLTDGIRTAQQMLARENPVPVTGQITFNGADPREGSRFDIEPGDEIRVIGYRGRTVTLYVPDRGRDYQNPKQPVTVQVSEKTVDALTLAQQRQRNAATRADAARASGKAKPRPTIDPWDCESNAGHIERFALYGGLWTVIRFPMSEVGRITTMDAVTTGPAKFSLMLFGKQVTSAQCIRWFGANPSAVDNPGDSVREMLETNYVWLEGWGGSNGMLGFYPKTDTGTNPVTGRAKEAGIDYRSPDGYLYAAIWADRSCFIELDFIAAPPEA